ncbi:heparinase II/III family protein [Planctomycetota bacterium]
MNLKTTYNISVSYRICLIFVPIAICLLTSFAIATELDLTVMLSERRHPCLTCTAEELERLRQAYSNPGIDREVVAAYVKEAEGFIGDPIVFPPRGGQHNQWYQCDKCQIALRTVDATHHRCPKCGKVYSGHPYDDVIFSHQHSRNLQRMLTAAWAYAISKEGRFAEYSARVLLGYAERYKNYPYHSASLDTVSSWGRKAGGHLFEQTLNEASSLATRIGPAYDLIHDSSVLSQAEHKKIHQGLLLPMLNNIDKNKAGKSNWQSWHNAAMLWGGALIHEPTWITKAIRDDENGFYYQMDISVSKEGMWYENSWGYHFYTLSALVNMAETARHMSIDLWSDERLKRMFTLPVYYTMANGMLPRFGDDVNSSVKRIGRLLEPAYHSYQDPQILSLMGDRQNFEAIRLGRSAQSKGELSKLTSMIFEDAGHAILRTHSQAGLTAAMTFGPYGGFHGHYDKLSFVFFGFTRELGVDPGRARSQAYRLPIHTNWYLATISHNTVLVDRRSQKPAAGKLILFESKNDYTVVAASCDQAHPDVEHTRWLVMTGNYLLIFDTLQSDSEHQFDWIYHNRGDKIVCDVAQDHVNLTDNYAGGEYIQNCKQGVTAKMISIRFENPDVSTYLTVAAQEDTTITIGEGVGASITDRVPMTMIGRGGRGAHFAAVLEPVAAGKQPRITGIRCTKVDESLTIAVERGRQTDRVRIFPDNSVQVTLSH